MKTIKRMMTIFVLTILVLALAAPAWAADAQQTVITMRLGSPNMTVNGEVKPIDTEGTTPVTNNGRTMLPLRAVAEALGLEVEWNALTQTITLTSVMSVAAGSAAVNDNQPAATDSPESGKVLVAYFSATNTTEGIAHHLQEILDADIYEIIPEVPYTSEDLNYNTDCRANREQNDANSRPAISGSVENMADYDVVFIGYPIWWGQAPKIISTFLASYDFSGKTIVPFCTSGSSGIGSSATNLQGLTSDANWLAGQRFAGNASQTEIANWVNSLSLN